MTDAFKEILAYRNLINSEGALARSRGHSNRTLGHRSPDSPTGYYIQDNGVFQAFSGINKLVLGLKTGAFLVGGTVGLGGNSIHLTTPGFRTISFNGHTFSNRAAIDKNLVLKEELDRTGALDQLFVSDAQGRPIPLSAIVDPKPTLFALEPSKSETIAFYRDLVSNLGIETPNWLAEL